MTSVASVQRVKHEHVERDQHQHPERILSAHDVPLAARPIVVPSGRGSKARRSPDHGDSLIEEVDTTYEGPELTLRPWRQQPGIARGKATKSSRLECLGRQS